VSTVPARGAAAPNLGSGESPPARIVPLSSRSRQTLCLCMRTAHVDYTHGVDPYEYDGPLPDDFPNNPESVEMARDESPPQIIDADKQMELAKEGTPGPENPDARDQDSCMDEALHGTASLMHLLAHQRPSGIRFKGQAAKTKGKDDSSEYGVLGENYDEYLGFTTARHDGRDENVHGLTMEGVLRELQENEARDRQGHKANYKLPQGGWGKEEEQEAFPVQGRRLHLGRETSDDANNALMSSAHDAEGAGEVREDEEEESEGVDRAPSDITGGQLFKEGARVKYLNARGVYSYGTVRLPSAQALAAHRRAAGEDIDTYIHTCIHTYIHTYINTYIHTYIHKCVCVCVCVYKCVCVCVCRGIVPGVRENSPPGMSGG
jgi:hypothetical protein